MTERNEPHIGPESSILDKASVSESETQEYIAQKPKSESILKQINRPENKNLKRFFIIGMAVLFIIIALIIKQFMSSDNQPKTDARHIQTTGTLPNGKVNQQVKDEVAQYNNEELNEIRKTNPTAQPIPLENINNQESSSASSEASACSQNDTACLRGTGKINADDCAPEDNACIRIQNERLKKELSEKINAPGEQKNSPKHSEEYERRAADQKYMGSLNKIYEDVANSNKPVNVGFVLEDKNDLNTSANQNTGNKSGNVANNATLQSSVLKNADDSPVEKILTAGDQLWGVSNIALNSDIQGPVSLIVLGGEHDDAKLIGKSTRVDEYMRLELDTMVLADGKECQIDAIALDKKTTYAAIQSHVDNHVLYRYGWWGLGTVLSAIGKASEKNANQQLVLTGQGVAVQTTQADAQREAKMAAGELGQEIGRVMQRRIDTPSTVYVDKNEQVGIFFLKSVLKSQCR